jgi:hypothetical protein
MRKITMNEKHGDILLKVDSARHEHKVDSVELWEMASFAKEWFEDAKRESKTGKDVGARRREVLFSVCCVESYLLEWVRDEVLNQDLKGVTRYFPPGQKKGISEKWKEIPKKLRADGLITAVPNHGTKIFGDFKNLVAIRDGIVHARSSRPASAKMPNHEKPFPTLSDLQTMKPGWALGVVVILLEDLHETLKTSKPLWLEYS